MEFDPLTVERCFVGGMALVGVAMIGAGGMLLFKGDFLRGKDLKGTELIEPYFEVVAVDETARDRLRKFHSELEIRFDLNDEKSILTEEDGRTILRRYEGMPSVRQEREEKQRNKRGDIVFGILLIGLGSTVVCGAASVWK